MLAVVAFRMIKARAISTIVRGSAGDALALAATPFLTVFRDLTTGIIAGAAIGALSFIHRMSETADLEPLVEADRADGAPGSRTDYQPGEAGAAGVGVYRIRGALFFGSAASLAIALDRLIAGRRGFVLDFSEATLVDSTGANAIATLARKARAQGVELRIAGASPAARRALLAGGLHAAGHGADPGAAEAAFYPDLDAARSAPFAAAARK